MTRQTENLEVSIFNEDAVCYALYKNFISPESKVFFKFLHNISPKTPKGWDYWCAPEVDVIEIRKDNTIVAYELKGAQKYKDGAKDQNWPGFYDGIGQALAYLGLPKIVENNKFRPIGGAFDFVYLVHARPEAKFEEYEKRIFDLLPIGFIIVSPDGLCTNMRESSANPLKNDDAKEHFLDNLDTLAKHSIDSRIFRGVKKRGEIYFQKV